MSKWHWKPLEKIRDKVFGRTPPELWTQSSVTYQDKVTSTARLFSCGGLRYWELLGAGRPEIRLIQPLAYHYLALCAQGRRTGAPVAEWKQDVEAFLKSYQVYDTDVQKSLYDLEHAGTLLASLRTGSAIPSEELFAELGRLRAGELLALVKVISTLCGRPLPGVELAVYETTVQVAQLDGDLADYAADVRADRYNHYRALITLLGQQQAAARVRALRQDLLAETEHRWRAARIRRGAHRELRAWLARRQEMPSLPTPIAEPVQPALTALT